MVSKRWRFIAGFVVLMLWSVSAQIVQAAAPYQLGMDYQEIVPATTPSSPISVVEFFSYACPWCRHLEAPLQHWLQHKPKAVHFQRVPVAYNEQWRTLAKAYYVLDSLDAAQRLTPLMFQALQQQHQSLYSAADLADFVAAHGIDRQVFLEGFNHSPGIETQLAQGEALLKSYGIISVPTIVVGGRYYTNTGLLNGDVKKMMQVVTYLVSKVRAEQQKHLES